jgi:PAS domain S-box-containing protein
MELFSEEVNIPSNYLENFMGKRKTGELFYINASSSKVTKRNKVTYYIIVIRDETKRVESEQYFKAFSDASCEAMMIHDGKQIINFNNKLIELSEFSTEELSTFKPVYLFIFENYEDMMTRYNAEVTASYESILRSKSGKLIAIAVTSKPVIWEGGKARIRVFHDISSYKERIKYLEQVKLNHNIVISGITDLICCFDKSFNITFSNQIFCDYFNLDISKVVGTSILTFISEEDKQELTKNILNLDKENTIVTSVHKLQSYNENDYHESVNRCIFDDDGQFIEYQIVIKPDSLNKT